MKYILLKGKKFILMSGGAIMSVKHYVDGGEHYAHLMPDGRILRYCEQIGVSTEIKVLEEEVKGLKRNSKIKMKG